MVSRRRATLPSVDRRRSAKLTAVAALLVALAGGSYAARELLQGNAATPASIITCPPNAPGWKGRVTGPLVRATQPVREARIVQLVNSFRRAHGLSELRTSAALASAARAHSLDMLQHAYFSHDGPGTGGGGRFTLRLARYTPRSCIAENIAWGSGSYGTALGVVKAWRLSAEHRHIMLLPWVTLIGVGVRSGTFQGAAGASVATADFAG